MKELGTVKGLGGTGMPRRSVDLMVCVAILPRSMRIMISWVAGWGPSSPSHSTKMAVYKTGDR